MHETTSARHPREMEYPGLERWASVSIVLLLALSLVALPASGGEPDNEELADAIDVYIEPYVDGQNFSGTILLARGGDVVFSKGYGMACYEHSVPNEAETKFQIASVSKSFTEAAILLLEKGGELRRDDAVSRFIPDYPRGDEITINHLITHTSGLPRHVFQPDFREKSSRAHTTEDLVDWLRDKPLAFTPGERYGYSNANYSMLAHIIERVSGLSYGDFLETRILSPLGLENTVKDHRWSPWVKVTNASRTDNARPPVIKARADLTPLATESARPAT